MTRRSASAFLLIFSLAGVPLVAEEPRAVPPPVAEVLTQAGQAAPSEAIRLLDDWLAGGKNPAHALIHLARAQAHWRLAQDRPASAQDPERQRLIAAAEAAFTAAQKLDPALKQAHLGLAQCAAAREDWTTACREAAAGIDAAGADRSHLIFLANTALRAGDWRLATLAAQQGILRFPDDATLRRIELSVLVHAGRGEDARQAVLALLARTPADLELWKHLAWSAQETGRAEESVAALEAALALAPSDRGLRRQLAEVQYSRGLIPTALATVRPLIGEPPAATALSDDGLILLASRLAAESGDLALARAWLAAVPDARRSRLQRLAAARYAVQAGDAAAAGAALDTLVQGGETDPAVLTWAGSLADARGETARAEALHLRASNGDSAASATATLHLAAFYLKHERRDEARTLLAAYLLKRPDDVQARALLAQIQRRR